MNYTAFDTETYMIDPRSCLYTEAREYRAGTTAERHPRAVLTSPFVPPKLVLGSIAEFNRLGRVDPAEKFLNYLATKLADPYHHTVWHNVAFDFAVCCHARPPLRPLFLAAAAEGRLHDTMYLDMLVGLARGRYDVRKAPDFSREELRPRSLETLTREYTKRELSKDPAIRCGYAQFDGVWPIPQVFYDYARIDAEATAEVFEAIRSWAPDVLRAEQVQVRAALAFADMDQRGISVDTTEALRLRGLFEKDLPALEVALVEARLGLWEPKKGTLTEERLLEGGMRDLSPTWYLDDFGKITRTKVFKNHSVRQTAEPEFHLKQAAIRGALAPLALELNEPAPTTDGGLLSLDADFWRDHIPSERADLLTWAKHEKLKKIVGTYLRLYSVASHIFPRWNNLGARSGRTSASNPNIQNVPKRKYGIRSLFVPSPGKVLVVADYAAQEVYTLCEAMHGMGIVGPLAEVLQTGADIHRLNAARLLRKEPGDVTKDERQLAKVLVFGVGGGLGPKKLGESARRDYGIQIDTQQAKTARDAFLTAFWDIAEYLNAHNTSFADGLLRETGRGASWWSRELGVDGGGFLALKRAFQNSTDPNIRGIAHKVEQCLTVTLRTGQVRACCTYTEACNTRFQEIGRAHV